MTIKKEIVKIDERKVESNYELCFIFYLDDRDERKEKTAFVFRDTNGVWIKFTQEMEAFFVPYQRVLKIKPSKQEREEEK